MHSERFSIPQETADVVQRARLKGAAVWAVGTTSARCLEAAVLSNPWRTRGETDLFIRPPAKFAVVDRLITNFHLPRSTLMMLVAAFAGYELTMEAYRCAVREKYRFYSYGDAMVLL
jgi:S-adenosylmethionine:tRNA ribosyltransferase-isomerase